MTKKKNKIPVTIVTGFLGAGKTTLINQLLTETTQQEFAVIVNEFGEIGIDHQLVLEVEERIYQMNNGCLCCSLRTDIATTLHSILEVQARTSLQIDHIIIETTGLADPTPIAQTFFKLPELVQHFTLDSVLTVVDTSQILYQLRTRAEPLKQIAFGDYLLLSKSQKLSATLLAHIKHKLTQLNPYAEQFFMESSLSVSQFLGKQVFSRNASELILLEESAHSSHDHDHDHHHFQEHHQTVNSFSLQEKKALKLTQVEHWLNQLIYIYGQDLYRYKGVLNIEGYDTQLIFQGVNLSFQFNQGKKWATEERNSTFVFIGKNLHYEEITSSFSELCLNIL